MSSLSSWLPSRVVLSAAVVGIVGAAGLYIYEQMYAEKRRAMLVKEMGRLDKQVATMREELQALRELQKESSQSRKQRPKRTRPRPQAAEVDQVDGADVSCASDSEYLTDYASMAGTDGELDSEAEFYDVHSDSDSEASRRSRVTLATPDSTQGALSNGMKKT